MVSECFVPEGTLYLRYKDGEITLSRCCLLKPFVSMTIDQFLSIDDIIDYALNYDYPENMEFWPGSDDRCKKCVLPKKISQVGVGFSYACNLKCYNCFYDGHHYDSDLNRKLYFDMLYKLKGHHLSSIQLTDVGEPFFYYKEVKKYLMSLTPDDADYINFLTNGTLLSPSRIDELKQISEETGVKYTFIVSVDGITKESYEATRIGGKFNKIIENITYLNMFFYVGINFTIKKPNMNDALFIKPFFRSLGFKGVDIYYDVYDEECKKLFYECEDFLKDQFN